LLRYTTHTVVTFPHVGLDYLGLVGCGLGYVGFGHLVGRCSCRSLVGCLYTRSWIALVDSLGYLGYPTVGLPLRVGPFGPHRLLRSHIYLVALVWLVVGYGCHTHT